jgi:hypothetical protein
VKVILIFFVGYEFYVIFSRKHPAVSIKTEVKDFALNPEAHSEPWDPRDKGFDVALSFIKNGNTYS